MSFENAVTSVEAEAVKLFDEAKAAVAGEATKVEGELIPKVEAVAADVAAFAEHAAVEARLALGKDRIAALDELSKAGADALALLETEKGRALSDVAALKAKVEAFLASL